MNTFATQSVSDGRHNEGRHKSGDAGSKKHTRGRWSGWEIGSMVAGFVVFAPVGLVILGVKLFRGELWRGSAEGVPPWEGIKNTNMDFSMGKWSGCCGGASKWKSSMQASGNVAFEEYRERELERIEAERRKLMQDQQDFAEFLNDVRKTKDRAEFDSFMAARNTRSSGPATE